jgi:hypothetical protein
MNIKSNKINYNQLESFVEFTHKHTIPNIVIGIRLAINNYITSMYIDFINLNQLYEPIGLSSIILISTALEETPNHVKIQKVDGQNYSEVIEFMKILYKKEDLEIDYKFIGDFMIELGKVVDIDISDIESLITVGD